MQWAGLAESQLTDSGSGLMIGVVSTGAPNWTLIRDLAVRDRHTFVRSGDTLDAA